MKCSMDELKFAATWKSAGIQGAKFSIKVIFNLRSFKFHSLVTSHTKACMFFTYTITKVHYFVVLLPFLIVFLVYNGAEL